MPQGVAFGPHHRTNPEPTLLEGWPVMSIGPISRFTYLAFELNAMLDHGDVLSIDETRHHVDDGSIFEWLDLHLKDPQDLDGTPVDPHVRREMTDVFRSVNDVDAFKSFGVEHNGIALLLAYCLEGIQQQELTLPTREH